MSLGFNGQNFQVPSRTLNRVATVHSTIKWTKLETEKDTLCQGAGRKRNPQVNKAESFSLADLC